MRKTVFLRIINLKHSELSDGLLCTNNLVTPVKFVTSCFNSIKTCRRLADSVSKIDGNFHQSDYHFRERGQYQLNISYNLLKSSLSLLSNSLPLSGQHMQIICANIYLSHVWKVQ